MKKVLGLWNEDFTAKHKQVLAGLDPSKLNELMTAYQSELDMFGYQLNLETLQFQILD